MNPIDTATTTKMIWSNVPLPGIEIPTRNNMKETANRISKERFFITHLSLTATITVPLYYSGMLIVLLTKTINYDTQTKIREIQVIFKKEKSQDEQKKKPRNV